MIRIAPLLLLALAQDKPPSITYPDARESEAWIEVGGTSYAVDRGITWRGTTVYLSLTGELIAVNAATAKPRWCILVGDFWNELTFAEVRTMDAKVWAVELRPGPRARRGAELRAWRNLETGAEVGPQRDLQPTEPLESWSGETSNLATPLNVVVGNEEDFKKHVVTPMFAGLKNAPDFGAIDFTKHRVLAIAVGNSHNSRGLGAKAYRVDGALRVRLEHWTFQTAGEDGGAIPARPYGIFLIPKVPALVIVEENRQSYLHGPEIWEESFRVEGTSKFK